MNEKAQIEAMESLGINTKNKTYKECVQILLLEYINAMEQLELSNRDWLKQQIKETLKPSN